VSRSGGDNTEMEFMNVLNQGFWAYSSVLGLESLPAFLPSFFPSTKCYSGIDSSPFISRIFLLGFLKPEMVMVFFKIHL
jgi:hypothetical protein